MKPSSKRIANRVRALPANDLAHVTGGGGVDSGGTGATASGGVDGGGTGITTHKHDSR